MHSIVHYVIIMSLYTYACDLTIQVLYYTLDHPLPFTDQTVQFTVIVFLSVISAVAIAVPQEHVSHSCGKYLIY